MTDGQRNMVRGILLTPESEVLLMKMALPWYRDPVWVAPGGGVEVGESAEACLLRELLEETGRADFALGREIWERTFSIEFEGIQVQAHERYFLVRCSRFEPSTDTLQDLERSWFQEFRWWSLSELASTPESISPRDLATVISVHGSPPS